MSFVVKTKKWGNSLGVIIPSEAVARLKIKPGEKISIDINEKGNVLEELFGALKSRKSAKKVIKDFRKDLENKWLK